MICVGTSECDSELAVSFAARHENIWASIGVHPHDAKLGVGNITELTKHKKIVAIGEIGLDYFYNHSSRSDQIMVLESLIQLAQEKDLPIIFHVRDAFDDFWPVLSNFNSGKQKIRGVLHSFTDSITNLEKGIGEGLNVGINGISTFTKDDTQRVMYKNAPLGSIVLETDAPYLTPAPKRGKVNEPVYVRMVAECMAEARALSVEEIARVTTRNAKKLFQFNQ